MLRSWEKRKCYEVLREGVYPITKCPGGFCRQSPGSKRRVTTTAKARKSCERKLDRLAESTSFFRGAVRRYVGEKADIAIDGVERSLEGMIKLARLRGNKKGESEIAKILADFRKKRRKPIYKSINTVLRTTD